MPCPIALFVKFIFVPGFQSRRANAGRVPALDSIENLRCVNFRPEKGEAEAQPKRGKNRA